MADKKKIAYGASAGIASAVTLILGAVYTNEGGYSNSKNDPGGKTMLGVTESVARMNGYRGDMRGFPKECYTVTDVCADKIYYQSYMEAPGYVPIIAASPSVGMEVVDTAVNMGTARPSKWVQSNLNMICPTLPGKAKLKVDGVIGKGTADYFTSCQAQMGRTKFCVTMLNAMDASQKAEYDRLVAVSPVLKVFYNGWINKRINNVNRNYCDTLG